MAIYRTAQGRSLDMSALAARHEKVRAVGNGKMNARGDIIDPEGRVVVPAGVKTTDRYSKTVGNQGAQELAVKPDIPELKNSVAPAAVIPSNELSEHEQELFETDLDVEAEAIKARENAKRRRK